MSSAHTNGASPNLIDQLEAAGCAVDFDSLNFELLKSLAPHKFADATSNQGVMREETLRESNQDLVKETIKEMPGADAFDVLTAVYAARVSPLLKGRVLVQTSPSFSYDRDKTVAHAREYAKLFEKAGISEDKFCIKIPTTSCGVQAGEILKKEGIASLGTMIYGLPQAIAAAQAGMHAISPYYNHPWMHRDASLWPDVEDPATQHPMSNRMIHIRDTYRKLKNEGKYVPQIKGASYISIAEVMAQLELGCDHVTVPATLIEDMLQTSQLPAYAKGGHKQRLNLRKPDSKWTKWSMPEPETSKERMAKLFKADPLSETNQKDWKIASTDINYLEGDTLDKACSEDETAKVGLVEAMKGFGAAEKEALEHIEKLQRA